MLKTNLNWIILAWDEDEVKIYQLRISEQHRNSKQDALARFHAICKQNEWRPFQRVDVYHPIGGEELVNITTLTVSRPS